MENAPVGNKHSWPRVLVVGLVVVIVLLGLILILRLAGAPVVTVTDQRPDALANSSDDCVVCHRNTTPGIVQEFSHSTMASAKVTCRDCHEVKADYPGATGHASTTILPAPTTAMCQHCHPAEVAQFYDSRHALPAWVAVAGSKDLSPELLAAYQSIPEGQFAPDTERNAIAAMEGTDITHFACENCHSVGKPAVDGSVGRCQTCHQRHEFSLAQVRKPETCNACHIGPDHPQFEIYTESPHGIAYQTSGQNWNWTAAAGTLTVNDIPAPTCATCHFSSFGGTATTHKVGERLTWFLFSSISQRRPAWQDNMVRMQTVCMECHNKTFVNDFYTASDKAVVQVNTWVTESQQILQPLVDQKLLTATPFDTTIKFDQFELWHHYGRTAKFGTWMQGPDYTQWHGAYEVVKRLVELRESAATILKNAGK
jgi:hydroxylamine dehydrogenase